MILSPQALAKFIEMKLKEGNTQRDYFLKGFEFEPAEITVTVRKDPHVPGAIAISCTGEEIKPKSVMFVETDFDSRCRLWLSSGDTGLSSETIFHTLAPRPALCHIDTLTNGQWPCDNSDFGRCSRLLERFPEWRSRLGEVTTEFPAWRPFVTAWADMEAMYQDQVAGDKAAGTRLYARMKTLEHDAYEILNRALDRDGYPSKAE